MSALRIDVIEDDRSLAHLEDAWTRLLAETPASSGFQSFAWVSACRSGLPADPGALFTLVLCDGADTVAMLAIEPRRSLRTAVRRAHLACAGGAGVYAVTTVPERCVQPA